MVDIVDVIGVVSVEFALIAGVVSCSWWGAGC